MENAVKLLDSIKGLIISILSLAVIIVIIVAVIMALNDKPNDNGKMSIEEAQKKCTVMEAVDLRKYNGVGNDVWDLASKHCFAGWDRSINPDNTDEKFIDIITSDWEERKHEEIEGQTIEELYNEVKDNI